MAKFPEIYEKQAKIFKAIGHPGRLMMVEALLESPKSVSDLTKIVKLEMPTVSRHLSILKEAQVLRAQKTGNTMLYSIALPCLRNFLNCSKAVVSKKPDSPTYCSLDE